MAHAIRKVWLEPEEQHASVVLQPRPRRRRQPAPATPQRPLSAMLLVVAVVSVGVGLLTIYIGTYARIAQYAFHRQALQQKYGQLNRECLLLKLQIDHLATQPRLTQVAQAQGLAIPDTERLHCVRVTSSPQWALLARSTPEPPRSWLAQSRRQLVAALDQAMQRLGRGPGSPAYAQ